MKRFRILLPLLCAIGMLLPKEVFALPEKFSHYPSASDVIAEVNALRASNGLMPYQVNSTLMAIAQAHSEYQASSGIVTHYGADGSRPYQRALTAGYSVAGDLSKGGFFSENIASGADLSASGVVKEWQGDSLHLGTMTSPDLRDMGVGVAVANGVTYYTLDAGLSTDAAPTTSESPLSNGEDPFSSVTGTPSTSQPVAVSTALEDGTVYHIVQEKEALWSIALAYDTTVDVLKKLNKLPSDQIFIGQKLLISKKVVDTPTAEPSITVTLGIPTSTATLPVTPSATSTATPLPVPPASRQSGGMVVGGIVLVALIGAALGAWLGRRRNSGDDSVILDEK